jgi:hypothetical protein
MKKMSEDNEMLLLLKEIVNKVNDLEKAVYNKDNILMKSGFVTVNTPVPTVANVGIDGDNISKMDWKEINDMVARIEGGF